MGFIERIKQKRSEESSSGETFDAMRVAEHQEVAEERAQAKQLAERVIVESSVLRKLNDINREILSHEKFIDNHTVIWTPGRGVSLALVWGDYSINSYGSVKKCDWFDPPRSFSIDVIVNPDNETLIIKGAETQTLTKNEWKNSDTVEKALEQAFFHPSTSGYSQWEPYHETASEHISGSN